MDRPEKKTDQTPESNLAVHFALVVVAALLFNWSYSEPDRHPVPFALGLSWLIMAFVAAFTCKTFHRLDPERFRFARWEHDGKVYERIGIRVFHWILVHTTLNWLNPQMKLRSRRADLNRPLTELNTAEGPHAIAAVVTLAVAAAYILAGHTTIGIWLALINFPLNVYPVLLQRWNRGRVLRLRRRMVLRRRPRADFTGNHV